MIDIHSHILPGVDDGPANVEESIRMLELAVEAGTEAMVATPHADLRYTFDPGRCRELRELLREKCPSGLQLYSGCEVHLTPENIVSVLANPTEFTLNGGDCILLELPDRVAPAMVGPAIGALTDAGLRVIIAHPERNPYIQHHLSFAEQLVGDGCYLQLTARSLSGGFGPVARTAGQQILKRRFAHFIASDAHGSTKRRPGLASIFDDVRNTLGDSIARTLLVENPASALKSGDIRPMPAACNWFSSWFSKAPNALRNTAHP